MANYSNRTGYAWNNIYELFNEIGHAFVAQGVDVAFSFKALEGPADCIDPDLRVRILELDPAPRSIRGIVRFVRAIRAERVRFLYLTDQRTVSLIYPVLRAAGVRGIVVHNRVSVPDPNPAQAADYSLRGWLKWLAARVPMLRADRTYAVSEFVRRRLVLRARLPKDRVVTILNGIRLPGPVAPRNSVQGNLVHIFAGGRATRFKGIHVLIRAAAYLRSFYGIEGFHVTYAGDGPDMTTFQELVSDLDLAAHVSFLGEVPSTRGLLEEADIVVVPSTWGDACPSAVSEALASGAAVVATSVGGVPELVGGSENAILVPPDDAEAIAAALARLIRSPLDRASYAANGMRRAKDALDQVRYHSDVVRQMLSDFEIGSGQVQR